MVADLHTFFRDTYHERLSEATEDHRAYCGELAEDWTEHQATSGLTVARYLSAFQDEVRGVMHESGVFGMHYEPWKEYEPIIKKYLADNPDGLVADMMTRRESGGSVRHMYKSRVDDAFWLPYVIYAESLFNTAFSQMSRYEPERVLDNIHGLDVDDPVKDALHASIDWQLLKGAQYTPDIEHGYEKIRYASSDMARLAMNAALDNKLLKIALKDKELSSSRGTDLIIEHASTSQARDTMLGYLAMKASGDAGKSVYGARYQPRVTREFTTRLQTERIRAKNEKLREEIRESMRAADEARRKLREEIRESRRAAEEARRKADEAWRAAEEHFKMYENTYGSQDRVRASTAERDPVAAAIQKVSEPRCRTTLACLDKGEILRVMDTVDELRREDPDISARRVYAHFHRIAQHESVTEQQTLELNIIDLLLGGDKSKTANLPF